MTKEQPNTEKRSKDAEGIGDAMFKIQRALSNPKRSKDAQVRNKEGRVVGTYKYVELSDVLAAIECAIQETGVTVWHTSYVSDNAVIVEARHIPSGEAYSVTIPLTTEGQLRGMQALGSAITYARKYGLQMLFGIASEDDDGQAATREIDRQKQKMSYDEARILAGDILQQMEGQVTLAGLERVGRQHAEIIKRLSMEHKGVHDEIIQAGKAHRAKLEDVSQISQPTAGGEG